MHLKKLLATGATLVLLGCPSESSGGNDNSDADAESGIMSFGPTEDDSTTASESDTESETGSGSEGGSGDESGVVGLNCRNIDFVFVVDNSQSMADEQQHLAAAVPGFVNAMQTAIPTVQTLRVGVVDTDTYPAIGSENPLDGCPAEADCSSCDYTLGALLDKPGSAVDPDASCDFSTGLRYMDGTAETFAGEFECAAIVGTDGNPVEQQATALIEAVSTDLNDEGQCNEGFVRDNALLVFLIISDEEDDNADPPAPMGGSEGEPDRWFDAIVAAKEGKEENIVALGLVGGSPRFDDCDDLSVGLDGAEQSTRLADFLGKFRTNFAGSVCSDGYDAFFEDALDAVSRGCMTFIP